MGSRGRWRWSGEVGTDLPAPLSNRRSMGQSGASSLSLETQANIDQAFLHILLTHLTANTRHTPIITVTVRTR